ncbi:PLP-dependent aminotransferase family protein [Cellulomonas soli]|uniref:MocR-like transcription factor YczR n=1 Tax=Cellulomonas soli TaxID=931535 RepID=UPI003F87C744
MPTDVPTDRRVGSHRLLQVLGAWQRSGASYSALADGLRAAVQSGAVPLHTRLPSERELATTLGVSRTTTTAAYDVLREEGFLVSRRGSGTVTTLPPGAVDRITTHTVLTGPDDAVDLSAAAPSAPPELHGAYLAALDMLPAHLTGNGYSPVGLPVLRQAIADWYTARGTPTGPDQVLVTHGAQQAIHLLVESSAGPGDRVVVEQPTYPHALDAVRAAGARPVPVPAGPDGLDVDLFESTVRQVGPRLTYLIPDHRNPTGTSLSAEERARVRAVARRHRTVIVGDEALTELTLDGDAPASFAGDGSDSGLVVAIGSASKSFWGGLRIGWVRAHPDVVARLALRRRHMDVGTALLEQLVTAQLFARREELLARRRLELRTRRDLLVDLLAAQLPAWRTTPPPGGLALWVDLGAPVSSALVALASHHGVRLAPGPAFGVDAGLERYLRLPFSETPQALRRGVDGLAAAWAGLAGTVPTTSPDRDEAMAAYV